MTNDNYILRVRDWCCVGYAWCNESCERQWCKRMARGMPGRVSPALGMMQEASFRFCIIMATTRHSKSCNEQSLQVVDLTISNSAVEK